METSPADKEHPLWHLISRIPLFQGLPPEDLDALAPLLKEEHCPRGGTILREGEPGDALYLLVEGTVEVSKTLTLPLSLSGSAHQEKSLVQWGAEDHPFFGEMGLLERTERTATVTALTPCVTLKLEREDFERLAEARPSMAYRLVRNIILTLGHRLRKADSDIIKLATALVLALGAK